MPVREKHDYECWDPTAVWTMMGPVVLPGLVNTAHLSQNFAVKRPGCPARSLPGAQHMGAAGKGWD